MDLPFAGKKPLFGPGWSGPRNEVMALAVVLLLAVLAWQMINGVATALYRQYEVLGDPPLTPIVAAGPELGQTGPPARPPSQLGHIGYFWSERAFHYRCALMFAVDDYQDPGVLANDTWQQHPDGVNAWREYALLMEPVYGFLYRLAGDQARPFVEFLLRLVPLIHVLIFFPLYAIARALGCRRLLAVLGVVFYATCTLGFVRMTGSLLLKEDFALLCLAVFLALHFWAWRRESVRLTAMAAVMLVAVLATWHLSQFLILVVVFAAAVSWVFAGRSEARSDRKIPFSVFLPAVTSGAGFFPECAHGGPLRLDGNRVCRPPFRGAEKIILVAGPGPDRPGDCPGRSGISQPGLCRGLQPRLRAVCPKVHSRFPLACGPRSAALRQPGVLGPAIQHGHLGGDLVEAGLPLGGPGSGFDVVFLDHPATEH